MDIEKNEKSKLGCSFCGKPGRKVRKMVTNRGVRICNECVDVCAVIIGENPEKPTLYAILLEYIKQIETGIYPTSDAENHLEMFRDLFLKANLSLSAGHYIKAQAAIERAARKISKIPEIYFLPDLQVSFKL